MTPSDLILALRREGLSAADIARRGKKKGREFSPNTITSIVRRGSIKVSEPVSETLRELYELLCK